MRRLVLTADLSLDGFAGGDGLSPGWAREYDNDELVRYRQRVVLKAGIHVDERDWSIDAIAGRKADGGDEELAPIVAEGGPEFCQELTRRDLVDEYRITVHPLILGDGDRLFTVAVRFYTISTRYFTTGSIAYTLVPVSKYRDHPPPYPWALPGSQGAAEHQHDAEPEDPTEGPAPG